MIRRLARKALVPATAVAAVLALGIVQNRSRGAREGHVYAGSEVVYVRPALRVASLARPLGSGSTELDIEARLKRTREHIEASRRDGDPRHLGRAHGMLAPLFNGVSGATPPPREALLLRATVRQSLHDFDGALRDLDALLVDDPEHTQAWLTRATVLSVLARHDEARKSCLRIAPRVSDLVATTCVSAVDANTSAHAEARDRLEKAIAASVNRPAGERAWALSLLGEMQARAGAHAAAERSFRDALALDPADIYTRAAFADLALEMGKLELALEITGESPTADALVLRRGILATRAAHASAGEWRDRLRRAFEESRLRGDALHEREEARFLLEIERDAPLSAERAEHNFTVQREPADVLILAEAACAAKDMRRARIAAAFVRETGLHGAKLARTLAECGL